MTDDPMQKPPPGPLPDPMQKPPPGPLPDPSAQAEPSDAASEETPALDYGSAEPSGEILVDVAPRVLAALDPAERSLNAVESAFESLCQEPVLLALELEPDCESGVITLPDNFFEGYGSTQLVIAGNIAGIN